jgi:hypothetical protein
MRKLTDHIVPGDSANQQLEIAVTDGPGQGGACHEYLISFTEQDLRRVSWVRAINFQNGPIKEFGVNGITQEALLAIVIDRLRSFQAGPYACEANGFALTHCEAALDNLQARTRARIARGVEGTHQK